MAFAEAMELKLQRNDHKGGWDKCSLEWLYGRALEEMTELLQALKTEDALHIQDEATDVSNIAMMIFCNAIKEV